MTPNGLSMRFSALFTITQATYSECSEREWLSHFHVVFELDGKQERKKVWKMEKRDLILPYRGPRGIPSVLEYTPQRLAKHFMWSNIWNVSSGAWISYLFPQRLHYLDEYYWQGNHILKITRTILNNWSLFIWLYVPIWLFSILVVSSLSARSASPWWPGIRAGPAWSFPAPPSGRTRLQGSVTG